MPLKESKSNKKRDIQKAVSENISELTHHGKKKRSKKQIIAIAINAAKGK
jgi:hypothetical protein